MRNYNIKATYVDKYYPWSGILSVVAFAILPTENSLKGYIPGQLLFGLDIILLIKHKYNWQINTLAKADAN